MTDTAQPHAHRYPIHSHIDCTDKAIWYSRCACGELYMSVYMRSNRDATPENLEESRITVEYIEKLIDQPTVDELLEAQQ